MPHDCKGLKTRQIEAIAQTRAIMKLNDKGVFGGSAGTLGKVTPNIQWEVRIPTPKAANPNDPPPTKAQGEIDLLGYSATNDTSPIYLAEVKAGEGQNEFIAHDQLDLYLANFKYEAPNERTVQAWPLSGYTDSFNVIDRDDCTARDQSIPNPQKVYTHYDVKQSSRFPGVLLFTRHAEPPIACPGNDDPDNPDKPKDDDPDHDKGPKEAIDCNKLRNLLECHPELAKYKEVLKAVLDNVPDLLGAAAAAVFLTTSIGQCLKYPQCVAVLADFFEATATYMRAHKIVTVTAGVFTAVLAQPQFAAMAKIVTPTPNNGFGDPHVATLDRLSYDLQAVGEFHLLEAPQDDIDVQARMQPAGADVSFITKLATQIGDHQIELGTNLQVDGETVEVDEGGSFDDLDDGASITRTHGQWEVLWPGGASTRLLMRWDGRNVGFAVPQGMQVRGLLGNANGNPDDDVQMSDGSQLPADASPATLDGEFADSWRITDDDSLFNYAAGDSTSTFTDLSFPANVVTIGDFTEAEIAAATDACQQANVAAGPQFEDCVLDVAVTGDDKYAAGAAGVTAALVDPRDRPFDDSGRLAEDFEGTVDSNFSAPHYLDDAGTSTMAGPLFDTPGYSIRARTIGRHSAIRLRTELYAFGNIGNDTVKQSVALKVDGTIVGEVDFEDTDGPSISAGLDGSIQRVGVGQTSQGTAYSKYQLDVTFPHAADSLDLQFVPHHFRGLLEASLGVDNIALTLSVLDADNFAPASLPFTAQALADNGGGRIESPGGQDNYTFTVSNHRRIGVQASECTTPVNTILVNLQTGTRTLLANRCSDVLTPPLDAGDYRLEIFGRQTGTYKLTVLADPAPQRFDLGDLSSPITISDGVPAPGAGNLETTLSQDSYQFTMSAPGTIGIDFHGSAVAPPWVLVQPDGQTESGTGTSRLRNESSGDYELRVGNDANSATFVTAGSYSLKLSLDRPQAFDLGEVSGASPTDPIVVSDGQPQAGAGNLETVGSEDHYTFNVTRQSTVVIRTHCQDCYYMSTHVYGPDGSEVAWWPFSFDIVIPDAKVGSYRIVMMPQDNQPVKYTMKLFTTPDPQTFDLGALGANGVSITDGSPASGAGNLETIGSEDDYTFHLDQTRSLAFVFSGDRWSWPVARLEKADGTYVGNAAGISRLENLPAGDYRLIVGDQRSVTDPDAYDLSIQVGGTDTFDLGSVSDATDTTPMEISQDNPGRGAGRLDTYVSQDSYSISLRSPGDLVVQTSQCENYYLTVDVYRADGTHMDGGSCGSGLLILSKLAAGDYRIVMSVGLQYATPGTYALKLYMNPDSQTFDLGTVGPDGTSVSDGQPGPGAGNLERHGSRDDYTFHLDSTETIDFAWPDNPAHAYGQVLDAAGAYVGDASNGSVLKDLPAGDYRVTVYNSQYADPGEYAFKIEVGGVQTFDLGSVSDATQASPVVVSDGQPGPGAGQVENIGSEDHYTFTVAKRSTVIIHTQQKVGRDLFGAVYDSSATMMSYLVGTADTPLPDLTAGTYIVKFWSNFGQAVSYSMQIFTNPDPQSFDLGNLDTDDVTVSDGAPDTGAGNLENGGSEDDYAFHLAADRTVTIQLDAQPSVPAAHLQRADGTDLGSIAGHATFRGLAAGDYRVVVGNHTGYFSGTASTYELTLHPLTPDAFDLGTLGAPSQLISDQTPGVGAGHLEAGDAEDDYTFAVGQAGSVELDWSCESTWGELNWSLQSTDGTTVMSRTYCANEVARNLPAGVYRLVVSSVNGDSGDYQVILGMLPPAQVFDLGDLGAGLDVSNGQPAPGAGRLESAASRDEYHFHVAAAQTITFTVNDPTYSYPKIELDGANGPIESNFYGYRKSFDLDAGDYILTIGDLDQLTSTRAYQLSIKPAPPADMFDLGTLTAPTQAVSDQNPGLGAGRLEASDSKDVYTFTVDQAGSVELDWACPDTWGYLSWAVKATDGSTVMAGSYCSHEVLRELDAGHYTIVVKALYDSVGAYSLTLGMVPPAQVFDLGTLTSSVSISDGQPADGAGNLEYSTSRDVYLFHVSKAQAFSFGVSSPSVVNHLLLLDDDGQVISQMYPWGEPISANLRSGTYRLVIGDGLESPQDTGTYDLTITPADAAAAQEFDLGTLGSPQQLVANQYPDDGAGNLESADAEDDYTFIVDQAGSVEIDWSCDATWGYLNWSLLSADGTLVDSDIYCGAQTVDLDSGVYRLVVTSQWDDFGNYQLTLGMVPPAQVFDLGDLTAPLSISDGQPAEGAGNLEYVSSVDEYTFHVAEPGAVRFDTGDSTGGGDGGSAIIFDSFGGSLSGNQDGSGDSPSGPPMKLLDSNGEAVADIYSGRQSVNLGAGDYRLVVGDAKFPGSAVTYRLTISPVPPADTFDLGTLGAPQQLISNQNPGAGAGNLESVDAEDDYTFTVDQAGSVEIDWSCDATWGYLNWTLLAADGSTLTSSTYCLSRTLDLDSGEYRLVVNSQYDNFGDYQLTLGMAPPAQVFDVGELSPPLAVTANDPGPGAGNLEYGTSVDDYRFTLASAQRLFVGFSDPSFSPQVTVTTAAGSYVTSFYGSKRLPELQAGNYVLSIGDARVPGVTGTYDMTVDVAPEADTFDLGLLGQQQLSISDQQPGAGAGRLESAASEDDYTFSVGFDDSSIELDWDCASIGWTLHAKLDGPQDSTESNWCDDQVMNHMPAGNYHLRITPGNGAIGTYGFTLGVVPFAQKFALGTLDSSVSISTGQPAAGAGNLEHPGWHDEYDFTLTSSTNLTAELTDSLFGDIEAELIGPDGNDLGFFSDHSAFDGLVPGDYRLVVGNSYFPLKGTYAMSLTTTSS